MDIILYMVKDVKENLYFFGYCLSKGDQLIAADLEQARDAIDCKKTFFLQHPVSEHYISASLSDFILTF